MQAWMLVALAGWDSLRQVRDGVWTVKEKIKLA